MEMLTLPLSLVAFAVTLWITSFFANLLHAKKSDMGWIALSWLIALIVSAAMLIGINILALDKFLAVAAIFFLPLVILSLAYKLVNKMNWAAAITTNVISIAVSVIAVVLTIIASGKPLEKTIIKLASTAGLIEEVATDNTASVLSDEASEEDVEDIVLTDADFLSPKVVAALETQKKRAVKSYKEPKFRLISVRRASGAIGYKIRLLKNNGKVVEGALSKIRGRELIVKQNISGGIATTPISMNSVKKLEVYR